MERKLKGAAIGVGIAIVGLAIFGGAALLGHLAGEVTKKYGPGCEVAVILSLLLLASATLGAELFKND